MQDLVLTQEGRRQLAAGELEFAYFSVHDDEIDYDPAVYSSGSLDDESLAALTRLMIEDTPVFEAMHGKPYSESRDVDDCLVPGSFVFDSAGESRVLPRLTVSPQLTSSLIEVDQATTPSPSGQVGPGVIRRSNGSVDLRPSLEGGPAGAGFTVRLFVSGSTGLEEVGASYDTLGRRSYGLLAHISVDDEPRPSVAPVVVRTSRVRSA